MEASTASLCTRCGDPAPDGPLFSTGLLCWDCADDAYDALRLWRIGA
jgi:hypothetical protein